MINIDLTKISSIAFDSRAVERGSLFVATRGTQVDGHDYIAKAIERGAKVIVCETLPEVQLSDVEYIKVEDSHAALGELASAFYGNPSRKLKLVGVTGTNGKTTTATLLCDLFTKLGYKVGLLSTVVNRIAGREVAATHTTPDPVELNELLAQMVVAGCDYCFMEVSSHSLVQRRTAGLTFVGGIFTNITHDHLDYHGTFAEYLKAKKSFFDALPREAFALTNLDDRNGEVMLQNCKAHLVSYSLRALADYHIQIIESHLDGMLLRVNDNEVCVNLLGQFNAYNLGAIYGAAIELGAPSDEVLVALSTLRSVNGRFDTLRSRSGVLAVVDYAHTPDALQNVLTTIREIRSNGQVITLVGCGGDRDTTKRPEMARIAAELSDRVILTSDNPRSEEPAEILSQMNAGLDPVLRRRTLTIENRAEAIRAAVAFAGSDDIILVAGKGHETYQEIKGVKHHFDDKEEIQKAFAQ
ncbi:MAG: UDP-N-acetylmuramoyl-L-alanyl-D-glutamate--2,6-diaminopimelate ligase [Mucinivorans sp.]